MKKTRSQKITYNRVMTDSYGKVHRTNRKYTLLSATHRNSWKLSILQSVQEALTNTNSTQNNFHCPVRRQNSINSNTGFRQNTNTCQQNNIHFNQQMVIDNIRKEIKTFLQSTRSKTTYRKLWYIIKAVVRGKLTCGHIQTPGKSQINNLIRHLKFLEKKPK